MKVGKHFSKGRIVPSKKTHYEVLGVNPQAEIPQIKKAYLQRARLLHPDNNRGLSKSESQRRSREMQELNVAWDVISDETKRRRYDEQLVEKTTPSKQGFTYQDISEDFTATGESVRPKGPEFATREEMEIRGIAKLMKPLPLTVLFLIVIGVLIGGLIITGNSENTAPVTEYVPVDEEMTPIKCIDIAPVEDVPCDGRNDAIVWEIIPADSKCSRGLEPEYASQIGGIYCVVYIQ